MKRTCATLLVFAGILMTSEAQAQHLFRKGMARQSLPGTVSTIPTASAATAAPRVYTYSYYTRSSLPARTYVGYGDNDFPFHGAPYGHPYDPYTWTAMSNSYQAGLARYYSPPLK